VTVNKYNATTGFSLLKMKSLSSLKQEEAEIIGFSGEKEKVQKIYTVKLSVYILFP